MNVLMLTSNEYDDAEVLYPYYRLLEENCAVDVASFEKAVLPGKHFFRLQAGLTFEEIDCSGYGALVLPGGKAPEKIRLNGAAIGAVRWFMEHGLPVAAICHGPQLLISAGVLSGRSATCYPGIRDDLVNAGARYLDSPAVVDGNLVTSRRPDDLPCFMREFVKLLK
jgi:protease I